jgi:hypothetical protein
MFWEGYKNIVDSRHIKYYFDEKNKCWKTSWGDSFYRCTKRSKFPGAHNPENLTSEDRGKAVLE